MSFNWGIVEMGLPSKWIFLKKKCSFSVQSKLQMGQQNLPLHMHRGGRAVDHKPRQKKKTTLRTLQSILNQYFTE